MPDDGQRDERASLVPKSPDGMHARLAKHGTLGTGELGINSRRAAPESHIQTQQSGKLSSSPCGWRAGIFRSRAVMTAAN
ncbi:hypothetical protein JTE90_024299 [Oedothorax gibbosus]|uniref:Uncharacterized protein n=1 Tax=Oedothorax gibbosus TaxID=931172 RepID=A0AAV6VZ90_9ARAC|nr:hypothetical protein JTE90_024299 [Oedothorax gibbosus]